MARYAHDLATHGGADAVKLTVHSLLLGDMQNLVYLIEDPQAQHMAVVDPGWDVAAICTAAGEAAITDILVTHWHDDHTNGIAELVEATAARVHILQVEAHFWGIESAPFVCHADGDRIRLGNIDIQVLHTPGHSPGSACFLADGALFSGDTLFIFGCGRCDLPGGDAQAMFHTLRRLQERLPPDTVLYPGHDYAEKQVSTLGEQTRLNPFLHQDTIEAFVAFRNEHNDHRHPPYQPVSRGAPAW